MALFSRQPFAELGTPRLHALQSSKNRQNAITAPAASAFSFDAPTKPSPAPSTGKRRASAVFHDQDSENVDPLLFASPSKKPKTLDAKYALGPAVLSSPVKPRPVLAPSSRLPSVRKALSSPNTATSTPVSLSRGSPKHKRIGLLSKRRQSSSPFRRVDPPSFAQASPALPFSIDAALSGTIPNYTPKPAAVTPAASPAPTLTPALDESMPKSWFFEIHEDTPEQEASNLMEHSASVLDISSEDDFETRRRNENLERGKENIPPPDFLATQAPASPEEQPVEGAAPATRSHVKMPRLRKLAQDAMEEDRRPLADLPAAEFYGEGCDKETYVTVDASLERPSRLSNEFQFDCPSPEKQKESDVVAPAAGEIDTASRTASVDVVEEAQEVIFAPTEQLESVTAHAEAAES